MVEFDTDQLEKRAAGKGGIWRLPPAFDGHQRSPLPRFTALNAKERARIKGSGPRKLLRPSWALMNPKKSMNSCRDRWMCFTVTPQGSQRAG